MGEFNSDNHYIYYCGQESLRRNGVGLTVNNRVWNAILGWNLKIDRMIWVPFQSKPFNITVVVIQLLSRVQPHGLQHTRLPCPSLSPRVYSNSRPLSQWCHPTILSSAAPFFCFKFFPASGSFPMSFSSSHQVSKVLELQLQHQSFQWIFRVDFL